MNTLWDKGPNDKKLFRLLGFNLAIGLAAGVIISAGLLVFDVAHLRSVLFATREAPLAVGIFVFAMSFTTGALAMGVAVMTLPKDMNYGAQMDRHVKKDDRPEG
jgi:hypothetical protein